MPSLNVDSPGKRPELYMALAAARLEGRVQYRIAREAGIDPATLSRILNRLREPTTDEAVALAEALGRGVADLFPDLERGGP